MQDRTGVSKHKAQARRSRACILCCCEVCVRLSTRSEAICCARVRCVMRGCAADRLPQGSCVTQQCEGSVQLLPYPAAVRSAGCCCTGSLDGQAPNTPRPSYTSVLHASQHANSAGGFALTAALASSSPPPPPHTPLSLAATPTHYTLCISPLFVTPQSAATTHASCPHPPPVIELLVTVCSEFSAIY